MASPARIAAMAGGAILVAVLGAGGAYLALKPPAPKPPEQAQVQAQPPAPAAPASVAAAPAPKAAEPIVGASESTPDIATVDFVPSKAEYTIARPTAAYVSASTDSPKMYGLPAGLGVRATEQSKDGKWLIAPTEDGQAAFLPAADLGPYTADATAQVPALPDTVTGTATVIDTATLSVDGKQVPLFGVLGETGDLADRLQDLVSANGSQVSCQLQMQTYKCLLTPKNIDIARVALFNGAAKPSDDATDDYRNVSAAAQAAGKGVWK
jgi:hypothetical protein